jgi:hypothetical protein
LRFDLAQVALAGDGIVIGRRVPGEQGCAVWPAFPAQGKDRAPSQDAPQIAGEVDAVHFRPAGKFGRAVLIEPGRQQFGREAAQIRLHIGPDCDVDAAGRHTPGVDARAVERSQRARQSRLHIRIGARSAHDAGGELIFVGK